MDGKLFLSVLFLFGADGLKILLNQPTLSFSHMQFHGTLVDTLVDAGHEVHLLVPKWLPHINSTGTTKASKTFVVTSTHPNEGRKIAFYSNPFDVPAPSGVNSQVAWAVNNVSRQFCLETISNTELMKSLKEENYDVGITQGMEYCAYAIYYRLGIKALIGTSSLPLADFTSENLGIPAPRSYVPLNLAPLSSTPYYSYFDRIRNLYYSFVSDFYIFPPIDQHLDNVTRSVFGQDFPSAREIAKKVSYIFVNTHPHLDHQRPISNKIVQIGGITLNQPGDLDENTKAIFNSSKKGVVLFSFGSIVNPVQMPIQMKSAFLEAFKEFPEYQFIFRYPGSLENLACPENVHLMDWVPQTAILNHEKTKLFITHGGLNSLNEAAFAGVPLLVIPFFQDQYGNGALVRNRKIGLELLRPDINKDTVTSSLRRILTEPSFMENSKYLSNKLKNYPFSPKERFLKFLEYAAVYGDRGELDLHGAYLDFVTLYNLDIWIPLGFILNMVLYLTVKKLILLVYWIVSSKSDKVKRE